ncbi:MAG: diaminopimelate decarboxylase [Bryobacterales bacterium]|nr:diaminopimelate decarboxylase [Bryobacteraceae bacterium]MDW8130465.1 diaminopimelate decarboxylase [Bryobacterales bacterium]
MQGPFRYRNGTLYCEQVELAAIAAGAGTPCYVYSRASILERFRAYDEALAGLPHMICYAVKANSNQAVLALLAGAGAGFDIVSGGELYRVLRAGAPACRVVFSGVGKTAEEIEYALAEGIHSFNAESEEELRLIDAIAARLGVRARVALRVNPDVPAETHPYVATGRREHKFGVEVARAPEIWRRAAALPNLALEGLSCHIGSQLLDPQPLLAAAAVMLELARTIRRAGFSVRTLDLGGGLGVAYRAEEASPDPAAFARAIREQLAREDLFLILEPGRSIVAQAGVLLTRVLYRKRTGSKEFVVVDAAMNDLIRPALYQSHHEIWPLRQSARPEIIADVVGPVCETGDYLARDRRLANALPGDLLAIATAGAYAFVAASNYNSRPRPPEVLVEGDRWRIVRARETYEDLVRGEAP